MDTLTNLSDGEKVVTTGAAGQRIWTADGNGNLIDVAGAPVPLDYFASHVAASTIVPYRDGMEDNPMPTPGSVVERGGNRFLVLGPKPDARQMVQLGLFDGSYVTRQYEYDWETDHPNIQVLARPDMDKEAWDAALSHYITAQGRLVYHTVAKRMAHNATGDAKARLREFADKFGDDDFWQFLQAFDLVPTIARTITVTVGGRASVATSAFGEGFEAGGTATWKKNVTTTLTVLPEAGCICDRINPQDFVDQHKPASATTAQVQATNCGEGCNHN
jgi:hypothetical protein